MDNRKEDIILEIGSEWVRVGLVADKVPRKTFPASVFNSYKEGKQTQQYQNSIEEILFTIFFSYINCSCLNKTVIIVEKVYTDRKIIQAIAAILFKKFKIQKLQFSLSCVTPLYLTGRFSGLVISAGSSCVEIMPVFQSYPLFGAYKYVNSGTQAMIKVLKDQIMLQNPQAKQEVFTKMGDDFLADILNQYSNMNIVKTNNEETANFIFKKNRLKIKPCNITYSNLFGDSENEQHNIAYSFLQVLDTVPLEALEAISSNIVLAGGLWRIKGMQNYFKSAVGDLFSKFNKLEKLGLKQKLKFVSWSFNPSDVSWIGASVGTSIKSVEAMCLKRVDFEKNGFSEKIMQNYFLSQ